MYCTAFINSIGGSHAKQTNKRNEKTALQQLKQRGQTLIETDLITHTRYKNISFGFFLAQSMFLICSSKSA